MADTPDLVTCLSAAGENTELLPLSPFYALNYHFGMLLGVDDFETEQAYHRAKMRLHNAWLHREGVVWGMNVQLDDQHGELRVTSGLALDAAGHELHLEADACLNVAKWFEEHRQELSLSDDGRDGISFDAHVIIRFKACLTRQVPALSEPCAGGGSETAYSRVFETVEILVLPDHAPAREFPYHRLRLLFALEDPIEKDGSILASDQEVLDARKNILALAGEQQPAAYLQAFRRFAAFDEIDLKPATSADGSRTLLFPGADDLPVVLANINLKLAAKDNSYVLQAGEVDTTVRRSHVATATIQELLCGPLFQHKAAADSESVQGPRVDPDSVELESHRIKFRLDRDLDPLSVARRATSVSTFKASEGWTTARIISTTYEKNDRQVTINLKTPLQGRVRLIARGTGPTPLLGADGVPLAGAKGGPPALPYDGHDFVYVKEFTAEK